MTCDEVRELLHAYVDGEVDRPGPIEAHLGACADCTAELADARRLGERVRAIGRHELPTNLHERVRTGLRDGAGGPAPQWLPRWADRVLAGGIGLAAGACLVLLVVGGADPGSELLARELVSAHLRSLQPGRLVDVASGDPHAVKPWLVGRLDFAPRVEDLSAAGFPLLGGRTDYLAGRPVAALAFKRRQHVVNLFVLPAAAADAPGGDALSRLGFGAVAWQEGDLAYWAVSDVRRDDLALLRDLMLRHR